MVVKWPADCEAFHCYPLFVLPTLKKWTKKIDTRENLLKSITTSCILYVPVTGATIIRDLTKPRRRRQRERQKTIGLLSKTKTLHAHHAFLYISLPSLHNYDVKWPNFKFTWERERQGDKFYHLCPNLSAFPFLKLQAKSPSFKSQDELG